MNCINCKYWEARKNGNVGICDLPDQLGYSIKLRADTELTELDSMAIYADANDDSGLTAELHTGKDFGCIKFSTK